MRTSILGYALLMTACKGTPDTPGDGQTEPPPDPGTTTAQDTDVVDTGEAPTSTSPAPNYALAGDVSFSTSTGALPTGGCQLAYTHFEPDTRGTEMTVILTHGFMRGQRHMRQWAEHLASWGIPVVTPELCHASAFDTDHAQNGTDLAALGASFEGGEGTLYIGHSAGGLASLLAANVDADAVAMLGLDPVDSAGMGLQEAGDLQVPVRAILAESSSCNAQNNGLEMTAAAPDHHVIGIPGADHCSFENPTDIGCTLLCSGDGGALSPDEISDTIAALSTAYVLWQSGTATEAAQWWTPGDHWFDELIAGGRIQPR